MKFIGFTPNEMVRARDNCGVEGLFFTSMPCARGYRDSGMSVSSGHITAMLRVMKTQLTIGPRGGKRFVHGPFARRTRRGQQTNAVTWDGHYRFMRALYTLNPHGTIKTAVATYRNAGEFLFTAADCKDKVP
jgi:hypothetical protein